MVGCDVTLSPCTVITMMMMQWSGSLYCTMPFTKLHVFKEIFGFTSIFCLQCLYEVISPSLCNIHLGFFTDLTLPFLELQTLFWLMSIVAVLQLIHWQRQTTRPGGSRRISNQGEAPNSFKSFHNLHMSCEGVVNDHCLQRDVGTFVFCPKVQNFDSKVPFITTCEVVNRRECRSEVMGRSRCLIFNCIQQDFYVNL